MTLEFHPLANIFPLLEGGEFDELVADIKANGVHEPIVVFEDRVLDGRNRSRACEAAGIEPKYTVYTGDDPVAYVISLNLRRRHLDESQRAMVAARLATLRRGDNQHSPIGETSQAKAAELLNVGKRSVERAREVIDCGATELVQAVERGEVSVSAAADVATLPEANNKRLSLGVSVRSLRRPKPYAKILKEMGNIDVEASIHYFENNGGYCDCEILLNVDREWQWMDSTYH